MQAMHKHYKGWDKTELDSLPRRLVFLGPCKATTKRIHLSLNLEEMPLGNQAILGMALKPCRLPQLHSCPAALYAHKILSNKTMLSVGELAHLADIIRILSGIIILAGWKLVLGEPLRQLLGNDLRGHRGVRNDVAPRGCWHLPAHVNVSLPFYVPRMTPYMDHMSRCAD